MDQKEYLDILVEQIRCEKARDAVRQELAHHIEDQKEAFMMEGMDETEASMKAVEDMGDPVEAGISLDLVHRPKMEWKLIAFVAGLSVLGLLLQYVMGTSAGSEGYGNNVMKQMAYVIVGIGLMFGFCYLDYSRIGLYGKMGAVALLVLSGYVILFGISINGQSSYIRGPVNFSMNQLIYLYIPFFGGILYSYKGQGGKGLCKCIAWMMAPVFATLVFSGVTVAVSLLVIMMIQLNIIVQKRWIKTSIKAVRVATGAVLIVPVGYMMHYLSLDDATPYTYLMRMIRKVIMESTWIGQGMGMNNKEIPLMKTDFIITYVLSTYGKVAAILLIGVLGFFAYRIVKIGLDQKNQLGMVMGIGCGLVFAIQFAGYFLVNVSLLQAKAAFLPLFTYGGTGTLVSFSLLGILLSIYRYQNVLPVNPSKRGKLVNERIEEVI